MSVRAVATFSIVAAAALLAASPALAQQPGGGRGFGDRSGSNHGGPFTPGVDGPAGPYTPGTIPGGGGTGPFTPGVDGPVGPYSPADADAPTSGGPFSRPQEGRGFWGSVKKFGQSVWSGLKSVGNFLWTLGGWAPWAHMPATGTIPHGDVGNNVGRNEDTTARPGAGGRIELPDRGTGFGGASPSGAPGHELGSGATSGNPAQPSRPRRGQPASEFLRP